MSSKLIALVGESPNDTEPLCALLKKAFPQEDLHFEPLLRRVHQDQLRGSLLDRDFQKKKRTQSGEFDGRRQPPRFQTILRVEYESKHPEIVVFVRDLDALEGDKKALRDKKSWFSKAKAIVDKKALFLLNIYEIEALIWADIDVFKLIKRYKDIEFEACTDPMLLEKPKEELQKYFPYQESDSKEIIPLLDIGRLRSRCRYFKRFLANLEKALG